LKQLGLFRKKLSGNSLIITIIIGLVMAILCTSILLLFYYNRIWESEVKINERLNRNIRSGINLLLSDTSSNFPLSTDSLDLFGRGEDIIKIKKERWGLFNVGEIVSFWGNRIKSRLFLYGSRPEKYYEGCIYLADHQTSLSVIGDVKLTGDAYLSGSGIKPGYINQRGYSFSELLTGDIQKSNRSLPALNESIKQYLFELINRTKSQTAPEIITEIPADSLSQSFSDSTLTVFQHNKIIIANKSLKGRIVIMSDSSIEVENSATLENVMLVAPEIRFKKGFSGSVQAIASDSLVAEENANFFYPSSFVLLKQERESGFKSITIKNNCRFEGIILSVADSLDKEKTYLRIYAKSLVTGIIYVNGYVENLANVHGTILTDFFVYRHSSSVYINNLVDVEINRRLLPAYFVGSPVFGSRKNKLITWLQ